MNFTRDGIVQVILVGGAIRVEDLHHQFICTARDCQGGQVDRFGFVLCQIARPAHLLGRPAVQRVTDRGAREVLRTHVRQTHHRVDGVVAAQDLVWQTIHRNARIDVKRHRAIRPAIHHRDAAACWIQPIFQTRVRAIARVPAHIEPTVPIRLAIVDAPGASRRPTVKLADDAVILVKKWTARTASFCHTILPLADEPNRCPSLVRRRRPVFVKTDFFHVPAGVVNACHSGWRRPGSIPPCILDIETGWRNLTQLDQGHITSAVAGLQRAATDLVGRRAVAARAARRLVIEQIRPIVRVAEAVVCRQEIRRAVLQGVVHQSASANRKCPLNDQGHGTLLGRPGRAFWTVDIDVAGPGRTEWSAVRRHGLGVTVQPTVCVNHLADGELTCECRMERFVVFHDNVLARGHAHREAAPFLVVAVIERTAQVRMIRAVDEEPRTLGQVVLAEQEGDADGFRACKGHAPNPLTALFTPNPMGGRADVHIVVNAKPPRRRLLSIRHRISRTDDLHVQHREGLGGDVPDVNLVPGGGAGVLDLA